MQTEKVGCQDTSTEYARLSYLCSTWNGRYIHFGQSYLLKGMVLTVESFMFLSGYYLIATLPVAGAMIAGASLCFLLKKIYEIIFVPNELADGIHKIFGNKIKLEDLPSYKLKEGTSLEKNSFDDLANDVMKIEDANNRTTHVIFNYEINQYSNEESKKKPLKTIVTLIYSLSFFPFSQTIQKKVAEAGSEGREIYCKGYMTAMEGNFLEHLFKYKTLLRNGDFSYNCS